MAKGISKVVKLQTRGGQTNPSPLARPTLGAAGVNTMKFCKQFNVCAQDKQGEVILVVTTMYKDKSFDFIIKTTPAAVQLLEATKVKGDSGEPNRRKITSITWGQAKAITEDEMSNLSVFMLESVMSTIAGMTRPMGITVTSEKPF